MSLWRAISYRLYAGSGRPGRSLRVRMLCFALGLVLVSICAYRLVPRFTLAYPDAQIIALVCCLGYGGIYMLGIVTDSQQRTFLTKLTPLIQQLPLQRRQIRFAYLYASLPVGLAGCVILYVALVSAFGGTVMPVALWPATLLSLFSALFCDVLLRITNIGSIPAYGIRTGIVLGALYASHSLFSDASLTPRAAILVIVYAILQLVLASWLVRRPISNVFVQPRLPLLEGQLSQSSALGVRALRTVRYIGSNAVLFVPVAGSIVLARMAKPPLPVDSAVLMAFLLTGTLGQEARALSKAHLPVDLVLYGRVRPWIVATWMTGYTNALVWIDICLAITLFGAPHSLSVGIMQAGCTGLAMVSLGTLAGHLIVPARNDILAQCASAVLYGALVWALFRFLASDMANHLHPAVWTVGLCVACLAISYAWERGRWLKDIRRRKHATI